MDNVVKRINVNACTLCVVCVLMMACTSACSPGCFLKPKADYDPRTLAPAPDYERDAVWAALPTAKTNARFTPPGAKAAEGEPGVDVFYVHPTSWFDRKVFNDPLTDPKPREIVDEIVLTNQASVFNGVGRVYAPRYRQSSLSVFYAERPQAQRSFQVAYGDVERAFDVFIKEHNGQRPFIVAGHSQGSMHAMRLLQKIDASEALRARLVAAYVPGFGLPMSHYGTLYKHLKPCERPDQTQCIASWDSYEEGADLAGYEPLVYWSGDVIVDVSPTSPRQCTNPVTWRMDEKPSLIAQHEGSVDMVNKGNDISFIKMMLFDDPLGVNITGLTAPRTKWLVATCQGSALRLPDVEDLGYDKIETTPGNYHMMDYSLFYMDIRANVKVRVDTWEAAHAQPEATVEP